MGADEEDTHERLKVHLQALVEPKIREYHDRIVKNTGDGMLVEFASVVDAVRCAAEVQHGMLERNAEQPSERRIELRIGITFWSFYQAQNGDGVSRSGRGARPG